MAPTGGRGARHGGAVPSASAVRRHHAQHRHLRAVRRPARGGLRVPAVQLPRRRRQRRRTRRGRGRAHRRAGRDRHRHRVRGRGCPRRRRLVVRRRHGALHRRPARRRLGRRSRRRCGSDRDSARLPRTLGRSISCSRSTTNSASPADVQEEVATWTNTTTEVVPGASHFFVGRTDRVIDATNGFLGRVAGESPEPS